MFDLHQRHDYCACTGCGLIFMEPMPDAATIAGFYPASYDVYEESDKVSRRNPWKEAVMRTRLGYTHLRGGQFAALLDKLASRFGKLPDTTPAWVPDGRLLDVGCGNGRFLHSMQTLGWKAQGVEFSADGVRACAKLGVPVHHGDLASAALPDNHFDVITVRHVIEHIAAPQSFMHELVRVLKPGGHLIMETPNSQALGRRWLGTNWFANEVPRHLYLYHPDNLRLLASAHGLQNTCSYLSTSPKILLNSLDYILENRGKPSKKIRWRRLLARIYVRLAQATGQGDVVHAQFIKPPTRPS